MSTFDIDDVLIGIRTSDHGPFTIGGSDDNGFFSGSLLPHLQFAIVAINTTGQYDFVTRLEPVVAKDTEPVVSRGQVINGCRRRGGPGR